MTKPVRRVVGLYTVDNFTGVVTLIDGDIVRLTNHVKDKFTHRWVRADQCVPPDCDVCGSKMRRIFAIDLPVDARPLMMHGYTDIHHDGTVPCVRPLWVEML